MMTQMITRIFLCHLLEAMQSPKEELDDKSWSQVLEHNPNHIDATWELAMLNMNMGDLEDACKEALIFFKRLVDNSLIVERM